MKFHPFMALAALLLCLSSRGAEEDRLYTFKEPHMGTEFTLRIFAKQGSVEELTLLTDRAFERIAELNQAFSDYLPESEINDLARAAVGKPIGVSDDLFRILDLGKQLSEETGGAFDVTAGPLIRLWRMSRKNRKLPTPDQIRRAKERTGSHLLKLDPVAKTVTKHAEGMLFDLGGIAKGYAADEALRMLREAGFPRSLVAASGDIVVGDAPPGKDGWTIGIETLEVGADLQDLEKVVLVNCAISTSADTRRYFEHEGVRYSHIVSTATGLGLTERIGASVIAPNATTTDSHATAVTILGEKEGLQFIENKREIECQIVALHGDQEVVTRTDGFTRFQQEKTEKEGPLPAP